MTKSVLWLCSQDRILIDSIEYILVNMRSVKGLKLNLKKMKMSLVCFIYPILRNFITKNEASNNGNSGKLHLQFSLLFSVVFI